mmetsp:Transcript_137450/g.439112  ORF Transcript_137450/g.439112 Transcript_137450/m.439112 type:complete len:94 (+) Transcript_137450:1347-1628(+)
MSMLSNMSAEVTDKVVIVCDFERSLDRSLEHSGYDVRSVFMVGDPLRLRAVLSISAGCSEKVFVPHSAARTMQSRDSSPWLDNLVHRWRVRCY